MTLLTWIWILGAWLQVSQLVLIHHPQQTDRSLYPRSHWVIQVHQEGTARSQCVSQTLWWTEFGRGDSGPEQRARASSLSHDGACLQPSLSQRLPME